MPKCALFLCKFVKIAQRWVFGSQTFLCPYAYDILKHLFFKKLDEEGPNFILFLGRGGSEGLDPALNSLHSGVIHDSDRGAPALLTWFVSKFDKSFGPK